MNVYVSCGCKCFVSMSAYSVDLSLVCGSKCVMGVSACHVHVVVLCVCTFVVSR